MRWGGGEEDATAADWSKFPSRVVFSCPWSSHLSLTFNVHLFLLKVSLRVMVIAEQTGSTPRQKKITPRLLHWLFSLTYQRRRRRGWSSRVLRVSEKEWPMKIHQIIYHYVMNGQRNIGISSPASSSSSSPPLTWSTTLEIIAECRRV